MRWENTHTLSWILMSALYSSSRSTSTSKPSVHAIISGFIPACNTHTLGIRCVHRHMPRASILRNTEEEWQNQLGIGSYRVVHEGRENSCIIFFQHFYCFRFPSMHYVLHTILAEHTEKWIHAPLGKGGEEGYLWVAVDPGSLAEQELSRLECLVSNMAAHHQWSQVTLLHPS